MSKRNVDHADLVIKPTSDIFTAVLWSPPKNEPILRGFLNAVLRDFGDPTLTDATVLNPFNIKEFAPDKNLVLDVRVRDEAQRRYNIEVQTTPQTGFRNRTLLYWADTYSSLLRSGEKYSKLVPVRSVIITEFPIFPELNNLHTVFEARARENPMVVLSDHFQMHFLRLGDMLKRQSVGLDQLDRELRHWMNFFAFGNDFSEDNMAQFIENDVLVRQAYQEFRRFTSNDEMREKVQQRQRFLEDYQIGVDAAKDEGRAEGKAEGKAEIAQNMKRAGYDVEAIVRLTGLSVKEIERLG